MEEDKKEGIEVNAHDFEVMPIVHEPGLLAIVPLGLRSDLIDGPVLNIYENGWLFRAPSRLMDFKFIDICRAILAAWVRVKDSDTSWMDVDVQFAREFVNLPEIFPTSIKEGSGFDIPIPFLRIKKNIVATFSSHPYRNIFPINGQISIYKHDGREEYEVLNFDMIKNHMTSEQCSRIIIQCHKMLRLMNFKA